MMSPLWGPKKIIFGTDGLGKKTDFYLELFNKSSQYLFVQGYGQDH